jgi:hypothetical protein
MLLQVQKKMPISTKAVRMANHIYGNRLKSAIALQLYKFHSYQAGPLEWYGSEGCTSNYHGLHCLHVWFLAPSETMSDDVEWKHIRCLGICTIM